MPAAGRGPLQDRAVLVAASRAKADALRRALEDLGARVRVLPAIELRPLPAPDELDAALDRLETFDWVVFTSSHGVRFVLERLNDRGCDLSRLVDREVCAVGPATADALRAAGVPVALVPARFSAEGVLDALAARCGGLDRLAGVRFFLPRARAARDLLPRALEAAGALVADVPSYENVLPAIAAADLERITDETPDILVFTSPSTAANFVRLFGEPAAVELLRRATVAAIGPVTARALGELGKAPDLVAAESTVDGLAAALAARYRG